MSTRKVVLCFITHGPIPAEVKEMAEVVGKAGVIVRFRNVHHIQPEHKAEPCDAVITGTGVELPEAYADLPEAQDIIRAALEESEALKKLAGDAPPVKNPEDSADPPPDSKPTAPPKGAKWTANK